MQFRKTIVPKQHQTILSTTVMMLLGLYTLFSQAIPSDFTALADSLTKKAPKTFTEIHSILGSYRNDTVLIRYFAQESAKRKYWAGEAYALNELGRRYRNLTNYKEAIKLHNKALEVAIKDKNIEHEVSSYNYLGVVYRRTTSIKPAMDYNQKALLLAETVSDPSIGIKRSINVSLNSIGNLYQTLKQYDEAINYFKRSIVLEGELNNSLGLAINHQNLGECQEAKGDLDEALKNYKISFDLNDKINNNMGRVICKSSIAQIYIKQKNITEALSILEANLSLANSLGDGFLIAPIFMLKGWANFEQGNTKKAEMDMLKSVEVSDKYQLREIGASASRHLSELYEKTGNYKDALFYNKKAEQLIEDFLNENTIFYVDDMLYRYNTDKKNSQIELLEQQNEIVRLRLRQNQITLWISGVVLALMGGIFYILYRQFQLKNDKKVLTLEQDMLRSQMNPHFLFNSLNSIKLYIINNEQKNAVHYLNKFSKLVRKILEASSVKEIALADELETVSLYMNIEDIRFSNEIEFNITVDEEIDTHLVKIPSLILQPFLENALWHGLSSKKGSKKIDLNVRKGKEGLVVISITDNGIGRVASEKIKLGKVLKRKSVGIDITTERLINFAKDYHLNFALEIEDLYDTEDRPAGTRVMLKIPTI